MAEKIYIGNGIEKTFDGGGSVISVHLTLDGMKEHFANYGYTAKNGEHRIKLKIGSRKNVGDYGETHTVEIDTWKPDGAGVDPFNGQEGSGNNSQNSTFNVNDNSKPNNDNYRGAGQGGNNDESDIPF